MSRRYPSDAYIGTVEALIAYGFDVSVSHETVRGQRTGWVFITAIRANVYSWTAAEREYMQAV